MIDVAVEQVFTRRTLAALLASALPDHAIRAILNWSACRWSVPTDPRPVGGPRR